MLVKAVGGVPSSRAQEPAAAKASSDKTEMQAAFNAADSQAGKAAEVLLKEES